MSETTSPRTASATSAASAAALDRRLAAAATLLRGHGWTAEPARHDASVAFNELGQHVPPWGREATYRCPCCGKECWYVRAADRLYHRDGSSNDRCYVAMHRGNTRWPMPTIVSTDGS